MNERLSCPDRNSDLPFGLRDATDAAAAVRRGDVRSSELVDTVLARMPVADADLNAIVATCSDRARREAARADHAVSSAAPMGPLAGVPISVKEAFHTVEMPTTWGLPEHECWTAD